MKLNQIQLEKTYGIKGSLVFLYFFTLLFFRFFPLFSFNYSKSKESNIALEAKE